MRKAWFWGTCVIIVILLFFQYPYMMVLQDKHLEGSEFSVTTVRGDTPYMYDVAWFGSAIIAVSERPGLFIRDTITYEHREEIIPLQGSVSFLMHAVLYRLFGNITAALIAGAIISTVLTILLLSLISKRLHHLMNLPLSNLTTSLLALAFLTFPFVIVNAFRILVLGEVFLRPYIGYIGRFISINHIIIFLLFWFYLLILFLYQKRPRPQGFIWLGISLAILQYTYFYYWTAALIFTASAFLIRNGLRKENIVNGAITYGTWLLLSLPYILNYFRFQDFNQDFSLRAGLNDAVFTDYTWLYALLFGITAIVFGLSYLSGIIKKRPSLRLGIEESALPLALLVTALVTLNIQHIIGYTVQQNHWGCSFVYPLMILMGFLIFLQAQKVVHLLSRKNDTLEWTDKAISGCILIAMMTLSFATVIQLGTSSSQWYAYYSFDEQDQELLEFLSTDAKPDDVLFGDTTYTNDIIGVNTGRRTLVGHPLYSRVTTDEIHDRLLFGYDALGYGRDQLIFDIFASDGYKEFRSKVYSFTLDDPYDNWNHIHHYYHFSFFDHAKGIYDSSALADAIIAHRPLASYRLDYVVYSKDLNNVPEGNIVFKNDRYIVRKI